MSKFDNIIIDHSGIEQRAHALRRQEISRLLAAAFTALGNLLRRNHERRLRLRSSRRQHLDITTANGTPA